MNKLIILYFLGLFVSSASRADILKINLPINANTLVCQSGTLDLFAKEIEKLVVGEYPEAKFRSSEINSPCFYREFLIDFAQRKSNGNITANIEVLKQKIREPIYSCKKPSCSFCDSECFPTDKYNEYTEELVHIDVLGISFSGKSRIKP